MKRYNPSIYLSNKKKQKTKSTNLSVNLWYSLNPLKYREIEGTKKLQLGGVPMFIIDGNIQPGAFQDEQMEEYIKKANEMKKAKK